MVYKSLYRKILCYNIIIITELFIVISFSVFTYNIKYNAKKYEQQIATLNRFIQQERSVIHVLKAELNLITSSQFLKGILAKHYDNIGLVRFSSSQLKTKLEFHQLHRKNTYLSAK